MNSKTYEVYYSTDDDEYFDSLSLEIENMDDHKDYLYIRCPVWNHLFNRTFVIKSPIDFEFRLNSDNILEYDVENKPSNTVNFFDKKYERNTFANDLIVVYVPDLYHENPIIQFNLLSCSFWLPPELKYVWMEFGEHPITSYKNNFTAMSGWFNLANHYRSTSLGLKIVDRTKPITIKKGDPLYRIRFYTEDLNDLPILVKKDISEFPDDEMFERVSMIRKNPELLKSLLFEKNV